MLQTNKLDVKKKEMADCSVISFYKSELYNYPRATLLKPVTVKLASTDLT